MKRTLSLLTFSALGAGAAVATPALAADLNVTVEVPRLTVAEYHKPYVAIWVEAPDASADLVFLDSARSLYLDWWPDLRRVLRAGGLLVVDNATSHAHEMADFVAAVKEDDAFGTSLVPVGKGEFLAVKA